MIPLEIVLTPNILKHRVYCGDEDFLSAIESAVGHWGSSSRFVHWLWNSAALLMRPDAIAGGTARDVFAVLRLHGFEPVAVRPVYVGAANTTLLWKYQMNVATDERRTLLGRIMSMGDSLYVIFRDRTRRSDAPATVHLTYLKGTAIVGRRMPGHLRTVAGPAIANILSYVHVSDDPADMLREMMCLFGHPAVLEILAEIEAGVDRTDVAIRTLKTLEARVPGDVLSCEMTGNESSGLNGRECPLWNEWRDIVARAKVCRSFLSGESYKGADATIPDDKELSLPLDPHLIFPDLGPPR